MSTMPGQLLRLLVNPGTGNRKPYQSEHPLLLVDCHFEASKEADIVDIPLACGPKKSNSEEYVLQLDRDPSLWECPSRRPGRKLAKPRAPSADSSQRRRPQQPMQQKGPSTVDSLPDRNPATRPSRPWDQARHCRTHANTSHNYMSRYFFQVSAPTMPQSSPPNDHG